MAALIILFCLLFTPTSMASLNVDASLSQKSYKPGDSLGVLVTMNDPEYNGMKRDVLLLLSIEDESGNMVVEKIATLSVGESRSKLIEVKLPEDAYGKYICHVEILYDNRRSSTKEEFNIEGSETSYGIILTLIGILFILLLFKTLRILLPGKRMPSHHNHRAFLVFLVVKLSDQGFCGQDHCRD